MSTQILVLDDSPAIVDSIEMMMELEGLTVAKFYKGSDMLDALNTQPKPDVILNGYVAFRRRRKRYMQNHKSR